MDLIKAAPLMITRGTFWNAAEEDALKLNLSAEQYLKKVEENILLFRKEETVYDRDELMVMLREVVKGKGKFALLLGGKSVGKSHILRALAKEFPEIVLVDARESGPNISRGLANALPTADLEMLTDLLKTRDLNIIWQLVNKPIRFLGRVIKNIPFLGLKHIGGSVEAFAHVSDLEMASAFVESQHKMGRVPTIVFDEGNLALPEKGEFRQNTLDVLNLFVKFTKQSCRANVLLVTSEHAEPFRLKALGFNTTNLTQVMFAGEISPAGMRALLKDKWGMGSCLADACLAHFGGHVWNTSLAINSLALEQANFKPEFVMSGATYNGIVECLKAEENGEPGMEGMKQLFLDVARFGFASIPTQSDPRGKRASKENIVGVVSSTAKVFGLHEDTFGLNKFGLVPASHSVRLMIAKVLGTMTLETNEVPPV